MSPRRLQALAWGIFAFCVAAAAAGVDLLARSGDEIPSSLTGANQVYEFSLLVLSLAFPLVGVLIVVHRPDNLVGWLLLAASLFRYIDVATLVYAVRAMFVDPGSLPFGAAASWVQAWAWMLPLALLPFLLLVYPSGRFLSPRWGWIAWGSVIAGAATATGAGIAAWPHRGKQLLVAPEDIEELQTVESALAVFIVLIVVAVGVALASLVLRYRRGVVEERLQLKWLALAVALLLVDAVLSFVFPDETWREVLDAVAFALVPVAIGVAVLRYRLYQIDTIINRTLVYVPLLAVIGGLSAALVPFSQRVFVATTGNESDATIVLTALLIAALIAPVRKRLEATVEHRFKSGPAARDAPETVDGRGKELLQDPEVVTLIRSIAESAALDAVERSRRSD